MLSLFIRLEMVSKRPENVAVVQSRFKALITRERLNAKSFF
jgi:hypothetical protein